MFNQFSFEFGDPKSPRGNCILYSAVYEDKHYFPDASWIASNIYVSYLPIKNNLPVVAFPPVQIENPEDIFSVARQHDMDVLRIPDFRPPNEESEAKDYFKQKVEEFNDIVMAYVELCKRAEGKVSIEGTENGKKFGEDDLQKLNLLEKRFVNSLKEEESASVDSILGPYANDDLLRDQRYDFQNLWSLYHDSDAEKEKIIHLFFEKFRAISKENYEKAESIQNSIDRLIQK